MLRKKEKGGKKMRQNAQSKRSEKKVNVNKMFPYLLLGPTVILIIAFMVYPICRVFYLSFQNYDLTNVFKNGFVGLGNFKKLFTEDALFWDSALITLKWVLSQVIFQLLLGMIVALILNQNFKGRGLARAISLVPWAVSGVLVTMLWTLMYDQSSGLINDLLMKMGLISEKVAWLADKNTFFPAVIVAELWRGIPFFAINLLAGLQSIPADVYESSAIDGCGPVKNYFYITLPYLKESIIFATLLRGIWEFNSIDMIFTMTNGGPMNKTTTLPIYMMKTAIIKGNYGYGSAIGVVTFLFLMIFAIVYIRLSGYGGNENE